MLLLPYIVVTSCLIGLFTWLMIQAMGIRPLPPDGDDGGTGPGDNLPHVDLPPGSTLSDWQTDRIPTRSPVLQGS